MGRKKNISFARGELAGTNDRKELYPSLIYVDGENLVCTGLVREIKESCLIVDSIYEVQYLIDRESVSHLMRFHADARKVIIPRKIFEWVVDETDILIAGDILKEISPSQDDFGAYAPPYNKSLSDFISKEERAIFEDRGPTLH